MGKERISAGTKLAAAAADRTADVIRQRGKTHGDAFKNLEDIANRWTSRLRNKGYTGDALTVADVCYFMDEVKLSRASFGDPMDEDHLSDTMGYSAIGVAYIQYQKQLQEASQPFDPRVPRTNLPLVHSRTEGNQ